MKGFLAVARREIEEKRFVFLAAAVASLVPFAVPIVRGLHGTAATEIREWIALVGASMLGVGLATVLGATVIASDLAERRLGFYFSRPISGLAIWAGKLGAAFLLALAAAAIVYFPTLVVNGGRVVLADLPSQSPLLFVVGVAVLVLFMHAGNILIRPRSAFLALDMAALILLTIGTVLVIQRLAVAYAVEPLQLATRALIATAVVALAVAGLRAVTQGRSDGRAAHLALSVTLWSILGAGLAATAGYTAWVFSVAPKDFTLIEEVSPAARGSWVMLHVTARGWQPIFLYDTATARYRRAGVPWREPVLSHDGTRAAWFESSAQGGPFDVVTWRLDEAGAKPVRTFSLANFPYSAFLSDDGQRLATISNGVLSVWDPAAGALLGSARVAGESASLHGSFVDRNRVRILRFKNRWDTFEENSLDILEFDLPKRTLSTILRLEDAGACMGDETWNRLLVMGRTRLTLRDGHTGALIAALSERSPQRRVVGRFTADGHIAVRVIEDARQGSGRRGSIEVFTRDGRLERTLQLPEFEYLTLGGEVAPGQLVVAAPRDSNGSARRVLFVANLATGEMRQVAEGLTPMSSLSEPGSQATKLFVGPGRSLVYFDALTGERRVILGKVENR